VLATIDEPQPFAPDYRVPNFWYVKHYLASFQELINHFEYIKSLLQISTPNKIVKDLFSRLIHHVSRSPYFPSFAFMRLGMLAFRNRDYRSAKAHFEESLKSSDIEDHSLTPFDALTMLAFLCFKDGDAGNAREYLNKARPLAPDFRNLILPEREDFDFNAFLNKTKPTLSMLQELQEELKVF